MVKEYKKKQIKPDTQTIKFKTKKEVILKDESKSNRKNIKK